MSGRDQKQDVYSQLSRSTAAGFTWQTLREPVPDGTGVCDDSFFTRIDIRRIAKAATSSQSERSKKYDYNRSRSLCLPIIKSDEVHVQWIR